jgi:hypothetical protein
MIQTEAQQDFSRPVPPKVIPALIHIQGIDHRPAAAEEPKRRIAVLLDYPAVRQLGWFSWLLAIVGLAATHKAAAVAISAIVLCGLLVGFINAARWLFARNR